MAEKICNIRYLSSKNPDTYDTIVPSKSVYAEKSTTQDLNDNSNNISTTKFVNDFIKNIPYKTITVNGLVNGELKTNVNATLELFKVGNIVFCTLYGFVSTIGMIDTGSGNINKFEFTNLNGIPENFAPNNNVDIFGDITGSAGMDSSPYGYVVTSGSTSTSDCWNIVATQVRSITPIWNKIYGNAIESENINKGDLTVVLNGVRRLNSNEEVLIPFTHHFWYKI